MMGWGMVSPGGGSGGGGGKRLVGCGVVCLSVVVDVHSGGSEVGGVGVHADVNTPRIGQYQRMLRGDWAYSRVFLRQGLTSSMGTPKMPSSWSNTRTGEPPEDGAHMCSHDIPCW